MDRDELARQGKQMASDLRDTVSQKVSQNEDSIRSTLGRAARWVDEKTGGKYSGQIDTARARVDEGIGRVASASPQAPTASGEPTAPGAAAGDPAPGATPPTDPPTDPAGPLPPREGRTEPMPPQPGPPPAGRTEPIPPQGDRPPPGPTPQGYTAPDPDAPRPPQV